MGTELTLNSAVERLLTYNYDLQIARQESQKSRADLITAKEHPNPVLNGSYEFMDINHHFSDQARGSNGQATLILSHPFETAGKRNRRIDLANNTILFSDFIYDEITREQLISLITSYYTLLGDQSDVEHAQNNADSYAKIVAIAKAKLDNGFLSAIDYQKIALQQIDYTKEYENAHLALIQDRETLASLLSIPTSDVTATSSEDIDITIPTLDELLNKIPNRPDCKAAKQNISVADASLQLEKAIAIPNVSVGAEYASFGPYYEPLAGFNFSIPIPIYDKNEGDIEKARIGTLQAADIYSKTLRNARAEIIQSYEAAKSHKNIYQAMSNGYNSAKELREKQEKIFTLKGISVLDLLDAQKSYRQYQKNLTQATIDLHIATARLKLNSGDLMIPTKGN